MTASTAQHRRGRAISTAFMMSVVLLVTVGCAGVSSPPPEDHFYDLAVSLPTPRTKPLLGGVLEVRRFTAEGLIAGRPVVWRHGADSNEVHAYHYQFWEQPPVSLLHGQLLAYLRAAGVASRVVSPELRVAADYALSGRLLRFERVLNAPSSVLVEMEIAVKRVDNDQLLSLSTYRQQVTQREQHMTGAASAMAEAVARVFDRLVAEWPEQP